MVKNVIIVCLETFFLGKVHNTQNYGKKYLFLENDLFLINYGENVIENYMFNKFRKKPIYFFLQNDETFYKDYFWKHLGESWIFLQKFMVNNLIFRKKFYIFYKIVLKML